MTQPTSAAVRRWTEIERVGDYACAAWFLILAVVAAISGITSPSFLPGFGRCVFALAMWAAACRTYGLARYRWKDADEH